MAAPDKPTDTLFVFTDGNGKTEPAKRKLVRQHVMLGRNRGKTRNAKPIKTTTASYEPISDQDEALGLLITMRYSNIPNKVGSEFSFTRFAAVVEPSLLHDILKSKRIMYPLESCIIFHKKTKVDTLWFELLTSDAAYMHAAIFASQSYIFLSSARETPVAVRRAIEHHSAALRLLRQRLSVPNGEDKVSDATVLVVLYLALHAHIMGHFDTAKQHMEGLRKIVDIRGGLVAFNYNTKQVMELLKCDLGIALNNGTETMFFNTKSSEALMPYDLAPMVAEESKTSATTLHFNPDQLGISADLKQSWAFLKIFCSTINSAAEIKRQLPKETLLNAMASVMYRLLRMNSFDSTSIEEAIRLGLLVFSSHIFLDWQDVTIPLVHLARKYRTCLLNLKLPGTIPSQILLWLLMIGSMSTFTPANDAWLLPWMRVNIELCETHNWSELRGQLKAFPWIDILHDKPGQAIFDTAMLSQT